MKAPDPASYLKSTTHRWITGVFGCLLVIVAVMTVVLFDAASRPLPSITALGLAVLGVETVVSAIRGRTSLLERIGPLP